MKKKSWLITLALFAIVALAGMAIAYPLLKKEKVLKIYQPSDVNSKLVDDSKKGIARNHTIADFTLTNQLGKTITEKDFAGKIYVADFFFATCPSICPVMSSNIAGLQDEFRSESKVMFLSHSVTPELDSVPVLAEYADRYNANPDRWMLTTGDKKEIYNLARKSYFAVLDQGDGGKQDFIHTENFILVDGQRRIRGYYDGTSGKEMERLSGDIKTLLKAERSL